jgi:hypothetical protein
MAHDTLDKNSPLAHFQQSQVDHATIRSRVTGEFGNLIFEPTTNWAGITLKRVQDDRSSIGYVQLNVKELNWLYDQLGRLLGR